jgi:hypothetical protein
MTAPDQRTSGKVLFLATGLAGSLLVNLADTNAVPPSVPARVNLFTHVWLAAIYGRVETAARR